MKIRFEHAIKAVTQVTRVRRAELMGERRFERYATARQMLHVLCIQVAQKSYAETGRRLNRDHTTIMHSVRQWPKKIERHPSLQVLYDRAEGIMRQLALEEAGSLKRTVRVISLSVKRYEGHGSMRDKVGSTNVELGPEHAGDSARLEYSRECGLEPLIEYQGLRITDAEYARVKGWEGRVDPSLHKAYLLGERAFAKAMGVGRG